MNLMAHVDALPLPFLANGWNVLDVVVVVVSLVTVGDVLENDSGAIKVLHTHVHKNAHTHAHTHAHTRTHPHTRTHTHTLSLSLSLSHTHTHNDTNMYIGDKNPSSLQGGTCL